VVVLIAVGAVALNKRPETLSVKVEMTLTTMTVGNQSDFGVVLDPEGSLGNSVESDK
jgi:hypothetical protein